MRDWMFATAKRMAMRLSTPLVSPIYGGIGSILMLHRVVEAPAWSRIGFPTDLEMTPDELEMVIRLFRDKKYAFVSLDELCDTLVRRGRKAPSKLAVITFDDGYRDNFDTAYPLLSAHGIPFTIYVATGAPDGTLVPWWHILEDYLAKAPHIHVEHERGSVEMSLTTDASRAAAFATVAPILDRLPREELRLVAERAFGKDYVAQKTRELLLTWEMIRELDASGLVTIGSHTVDHVRLPSLSAEAARHQLVASKRRLEEKLEKPVAHFSYPFGEMGRREFDLAREVGFVSAATTRVANIFPAHADSLCALPRVYAQPIGRARPNSALREELAHQLTGVSPAIANRGRRVVTFGA